MNAPTKTFLMTTAAGALAFAGAAAAEPEAGLNVDPAINNADTEMEAAMEADSSEVPVNTQARAATYAEQGGETDAKADMAMGDGPEAMVDPVEDSPHAGQVAETRFGDEELTGATVAPGSAEAMAAEREMAMDEEPSMEARADMMADAEMQAEQNEQAIEAAYDDERMSAEVDETAETEVLLAAHPDIFGDESETKDVELLQTFMAIDTDENLLISATEWSDWQGWENRTAPEFSEIDYNASGTLGFGEYRVWNAIEYGTAERAPAS